MAFTDQTVIEQQTYAGAATLAFNHPLVALTDLVITKTAISNGAETTLTKDTDYTIAGTADTSGRYPNGVRVTLLASHTNGDVFTLLRNTSPTDTSEYRDGDNFPAGVHMRIITKLLMVAQEVKYKLTRAVGLSAGSSLSFDPTLPAPAARKALLFKTNLLGFETSTYDPDTQVAAAATSATAAAASATAAASSATSASGSATTATTQASNASTSATLAADWATKTSATVNGSDYSAKEYAKGTQAGTGGSAKNWAQQTGADVTGASANSRSSKSWAQDNLAGATLGGSAKDWAQSSSLPDGVLKSAKSYAADAAASAAAINLPAAAGNSLKMLRQKVAEDGLEYRSAVQVLQDLGQVGVSTSYRGSSAPAGYLLEYGQAVSRTTYAAAFAVIGTTYGAGDGSTTFNMPDSRGYVDIGKDNMGGSAANVITSSSTNGANSVTLGGKGGAQTHTLVTGEHATHAHTQQGSNVTFNLQTGVTSINTLDQTVNNTGNSGSGTAHSNTQPWMAANKIMCVGV